MATKQATAAAKLQAYNDAVTAAATAKTNLDNAEAAKVAADTALADAKTQLGAAETVVEKGRSPCQHKDDRKADR